MRRAVVSILSATFVGALLVTTGAAAPALACDCPGMVGPAESTVSATNDSAILHWDGERETMELLLDVTGDAASAGIIIPTPTATEISTGDSRTFALIEDAIKPAQRVETDIWGLGYIFPDTPPVSPPALERAQIGPLEATTIAAADTAALTTWIAANGFELSPELEESLSIYGELGWSFTAIRLTSDDVINGHIDPIRVTFATERLVYPVRLARTEAGPQSIRLYVFDKQRTTVSKASSPTIDIDGRFEVVWAGEAHDSRLRALGQYLTVFDIHYDDPRAQVTSDLGFVYSTSDKEVRPEIVHYKMITLLGIPVGTLIVLWAAIGLAVGVAHVAGRRRAR